MGNAHLEAYGTHGSTLVAQKQSALITNRLPSADSDFWFNRADPLLCNSVEKQSKYSFLNKAVINEYGVQGDLLLKCVVVKQSCDYNTLL